MAILDVGQIFSEVGTPNPLEDHFFKHQIKYVNPAGFCQHIKWSIFGDIPVGVKVDAMSGIISGYCKWFGEEPSCEKVFGFLNSEVKLDGSNYKDSGRYKHQMYDFHFTIKRDFKIVDGSGNCSIPQSEQSDVYIKLLKFHDIDSFDFIFRWLQGSPDKNGNKRTINVKGKSFDFSQVQELKKVHPGPFYIPKH